MSHRKPRTDPGALGRDAALVGPVSGRVVSAQVSSHRTPRRRSPRHLALVGIEGGSWQRKSARPVRRPHDQRISPRTASRLMRASLGRGGIEAERLHRAESHQRSGGSSYDEPPDPSRSRRVDDSVVSAVNRAGSGLGWRAGPIRSINLDSIRMRPGRQDELAPASGPGASARELGTGRGWGSSRSRPRGTPRPSVPVSDSVAVRTRSASTGAYERVRLFPMNGCAIAPGSSIDNERAVGPPSPAPRSQPAPMSGVDDGADVAMPLVKRGAATRGVIRRADLPECDDRPDVRVHLRSLLARARLDSAHRSGGSAASIRQLLPKISHRRLPAVRSGLRDTNPRPSPCKSDALTS